MQEIAPVLNSLLDVWVRLGKRSDANNIADDTHVIIKDYDMYTLQPQPFISFGLNHGQCWHHRADHSDTECRLTLRTRRPYEWKSSCDEGYTLTSPYRSAMLPEDIIKCLKKYQRATWREEYLAESMNALSL